jgi:hypothetical protein
MVEQQQRFTGSFENDPRGYLRQPWITEGSLIFFAGQTRAPCEVQRAAVCVTTTMIAVVALWFTGPRGSAGGRRSVTGSQEPQDVAYVKAASTAAPAAHQSRTGPARVCHTDGPFHP